MFSVDARTAVLLGMSDAPAKQTDQPLLVRHITASYREHIKVKYSTNGAELHRLGLVCDDIDKREGDKPAGDYGPLSLQRQRQRWIDADKSRKYCNRLTNSVVRMFEYAVSQELVKQKSWQALKSVEALREGQTTASEIEPIRPVAIEVVRKTAAQLSPVLKVMIRVRGCDLANQTARYNLDWNGTAVELLPSSVLSCTVSLSVLLAVSDDCPSRPNCPKHDCRRPAIHRCIGDQSRRLRALCSRRSVAIVERTRRLSPRPCWSSCWCRRNCQLETVLP